jgi:hypothetical protein
VLDTVQHIAPQQEKTRPNHLGTVPDFPWIVSPHFRQEMKGNAPQQVNERQRLSPTPLAWCPAPTSNGIAPQQGNKRPNPLPRPPLCHPYLVRADAGPEPTVLSALKAFTMAGVK